MKELLGKLGDPRAAIVSDDPVSEAGKSKAVPSLSQYLKQQEDTKDLSFGDSVEARVSEGEREMTMKELLEKLNDPRAAIVSDDPVSEADKSKAVPSLSQYQKQQEDKQALFESLDRAEALAEPKAGTTKVDPALAEALEEETAPDMGALLASLKGEEPEAAEPEAAEPTGPATAAYEALDDEDQVAQAFEEAAAAAPEGVDVSGAAKAVPDQAEDLFKTVHGGPFDPNSSMDRGKLAQIEEMLASGEDFGDLSDREARNRFALKVYRKYDYV